MADECDETATIEDEVNPRRVYENSDEGTRSWKIKRRRQTLDLNSHGSSKKNHKSSFIFGRGVRIAINLIRRECISLSEDK